MNWCQHLNMRPVVSVSGTFVTDGQASPSKDINLNFEQKGFKALWIYVCALGTRCELWVRRLKALTL